GVNGRECSRSGRGSECAEREAQRPANERPGFGPPQNAPGWVIRWVVIRSCSANAIRSNRLPEGLAGLGPALGAGPGQLALLPANPAKEARALVDAVLAVAVVIDELREREQLEAV